MKHHFAVKDIIAMKDAVAKLNEVKNRIDTTDTASLGTMEHLISPIDSTIKDIEQALTEHHGWSGVA